MDLFLLDGIDDKGNESTSNANDSPRFTVTGRNRVDNEDNSHEENEQVGTTEYLTNVKCEDIMPQSNKVVVLDADLPVRAAFEALLENNVDAALIWDSVYRDYASLLNLTDFIELLYLTSKVNFQNLLVGNNIETLLSQLNDSSVRNTIVDVASKRRQTINLIAVEPGDSLNEACTILSRHKISAVPVIFQEEDLTCLYILTPKRLLTFLLKVLPELSVSMEQPLNPDPAFSYTSVAYPSTTLFGVLEILTQGTPVVPIVNRDDGSLIHAFSSHDIMPELLSCNGSTSLHFIDFARYLLLHLNTPIETLYQDKTNHAKDPLLISYKNTKISQVIKQLLNHKFHAQIILDEENRFVCVADALSLLVHFLKR